MKLCLLLLACFSLDLCQAATTCSPGADIAIVVDKSMSIGEENFKIVRRFLAKFVDNFQVSVEGDHIAVLTFNGWVKVIFPLNKYMTKGSMKGAIWQIPTKLDWATRTDRALKKVERSIFTAEGGDRPDRPNYVILFTDGKPYAVHMSDLEDVGEITSRLEKNGVIVIAVGYGKKIDTETLKKLAGTKGRHFLMEDVGELESSIIPIMASFCDGGYTDWSDWGECSVTCGGGVRARSRTCTNPPPARGGKNCDGLGPASEEEACNEEPCAVDGGYTDWSDWRECSVTCGGGVKTRLRTCTKPPPAHGGKDCDGLGPANDEEACNEEPCAPACKTAIDLGIIADVSKSVGNENLQKLKQALKMLVDKFEPSVDGTHVGLITFAKDAELHFTFADSQYQNPDAAEGKIEQISHLHHQTRTDKALIMANEKLFTEAGGDRAGKPDVLLVFTDGKPTPKPGYKGFDVTVPPLLAKGVRITAVGIGTGIDQKVLREIAGEKGSVLMVENFDKLVENLEDIKNMSCSS